jgi:hypothetical protein
MAFNWKKQPPHVSSDFVWNHRISHSIPKEAQGQ